MLSSFILNGTIEYWDKEHHSYNLIQTLEKPNPEKYGIYPETHACLVEEAELGLGPPCNLPSK